MSLSLKWKIQLWHALILWIVLMILGVGFYYYEKTRRLAEIDIELDKLVHPVMGPLTQFERAAYPEHGKRTRPKQPKSLEEGNSFPGEQSLEAKPGGWVLRLSNQKNLAPPRETAPKTVITSEQGGIPAMNYIIFEEARAPKGFYAQAIRKDQPDLFYISSNYPDVEMPNDIGSGYFMRFRDQYFREIYHETLMIRVLIGYDLNHFYKELRILKLQIGGGILIIFIFGVTIGGFLVSRSIRPLIAIENASAQVAKGELAKRIPELPASGAIELKSLSENLNHTFDQLEKSFTRQIRFTADASHELRTPLTALLAQIEHGLKRARSDEEYVHILEVCGRSGTRIQRITEQLIELSRYDSGRVEMDIEDIPLVSMLSSLAEELEPYVQKQGSILKTEISEGLVRCDPFRLEQVITNLINNALQHNEIPIRITLRAKVLTDEFRIEVVDTGKGIQPENLNQLFDRFYQESSSRSKSEGRNNVGLGLAISEAIVKAHGGRIHVSSKPNIETIFSIRIPLKPSAS